MIPNILKYREFGESFVLVLDTVTQVTWHLNMAKLLYYNTPLQMRMLWNWCRLIVHYLPPRLLLYPIEKSTHFWKINIFAKTAVFVICIPKSLNMHSEWRNIKECNKYPRDSVAKKGICSCFVRIPNTIVHNLLLCTKMHHLVSFQYESFVVVLRCHVWHVTDSLCFVYLGLHIT